VNLVRRLALQEKILEDCSRLDVVEIARASLTFFRACLLPGRAEDLSAPRVFLKYSFHNALNFLDDSVLTLGL